MPWYLLFTLPDFLFSMSCPFQTTGKGTASQRCYKTCARLAPAIGIQSRSRNAAVTEAGAGVPTVRSALSRALWPSKSSVLMAEGS